MPHSNGKIYAEVKNGVRYGVSTADVAAVLGVASLDVATLCRSANINPWAKFRPIFVPLNDELNLPRVLTAEERTRLGNGLTVFYDLWSANDTLANLGGAAAAHLNAGADVADLSIKNRSWFEPAEGTVWTRISDFLDPEWFQGGQTNGTVVYGYNHKAQPWFPTFLYNNAEYAFRPLIAAGSRNIEVEEGKAYQLTIPDDSTLIDCAVKWLNGDTNVSVKEQTDEQRLSLNTFEAMVNCISLLSREGEDSFDLSQKSLRGVWVLVKDVNGSWVNFGFSFFRRSGDCLDLQNTTPGGKNGDNDVISAHWNDYDNCPTTAPSASASHPYSLASWSQLQGNCVFIEFYTGANGGNIPIPGAIYNVNITRVASGQGSETSDIAGTVYVYNTSSTDMTGVVLDVDVTTAAGRFTSSEQLVAYLKTKYSTLTVGLYNSPTASAVRSLNILADSGWVFEYIGSADETDGTPTYVYSMAQAWVTEVDYDVRYLVVNAVKKSGTTAQKIIDLTAII